MEEINILCTIDKNYFNQYKVLVTSILENTNNPKEINFYLAEKDLSKEQKEGLKKYMKKYGSTLIILPKPSFNFKEFPRVNHISEVTYYKIYCLNRLKIKKIIYADPDVIFLRDIKKLFEISLGNKTIGGIEDYAISLGKKKGYINAGILLINLNNWKLKKYSIKCIEQLKKNPKEFVYAEQDLINKILKNDIKYLPLDWNRQKWIWDVGCKDLKITKEKYSLLIKKPKVIHFTGKIKPWHYKYVFPDKKDYLKYNKIAGFEKPYKINYSIKENIWKIARWILYKTKTRVFFESKILRPFQRVINGK